jgi:hypothetical protein
MLTILHTRRQCFVFRVAPVEVQSVAYFSAYDALTFIVTWPLKTAAEEVQRSPGKASRAAH